MNKKTNVEHANSFEARITFKRREDAAHWRDRFGDAVQHSTGRKMLLCVEGDADESDRLKELCDILHQNDETDDLTYFQYGIDVEYYVAVVYSMHAWQQEFGDYDKKVVKQEIKDLKYSDKLCGIRQPYKLLTVRTDEQEDIDAAIAELSDPK